MNSVSKTIWNGFSHLSQLRFQLKEAISKSTPKTKFRNSNHRIKLFGIASFSTHKTSRQYKQSKSVEFSEKQDEPVEDINIHDPSIEQPKTIILRPENKSPQEKSYIKSLEAEQAIDKGQYEKAIELLTEAIQINNKNTIAMLNRSGLILFFRLFILFYLMLFIFHF
jgi:hypothetical protein